MLDEGALCCVGCRCGRLGSVELTVGLDLKLSLPNLNDSLILCWEPILPA